MIERRILPDRQYLELAHRLRVMTENNGEWRDRHRLRETLKKKFAAAYGFKPVGARLTEKIYRFVRGLQTPYLDHLDFFQCGEDFVAVSQPYDFDLSVLDRWAESRGAYCYTLAYQWAYYYPGHATLFFIEGSLALVTNKRQRWRKCPQP